MKTYSTFFKTIIRGQTADFTETWNTSKDNRKRTLHTKITLHNASLITIISAQKLNDMKCSNLPLMFVRLQLTSQSAKEQYLAPHGLLGIV